MNERATLSGIVTPFGYRIVNSDDDTVYSAGNSPYDSAASVPLSEALPLETLQRYCDQTGREIAEETGATYTGHGVEE